jgi:hypothetical protein
MMPSSVLTKSVNTVSTWSRPARMVMMSELGCECFFVSTQERKTLRVYRSVSD